MKLSYLHRDVSQTCIEQSQWQFWFPKSAVEAIAKFIQIFLKISGRHTMKRAIKELFHVANHDMDKWQPFRGLFRGGDLLFVNMLSGHSVQRWQGIRSNDLARFQAKREERFYSCFGNRVKCLHCHKAGSFLPGLYGNKNRPFPFSTSAPLACSFPTNIGIIKFNQVRKSVNAIDEPWLYGFFSGRSWR